MPNAGFIAALNGTMEEARKALVQDQTTLQAATTAAGIEGLILEDHDPAKVSKWPTWQLQMVLAQETEVG